MNNFPSILMLNMRVIRVQKQNPFYPFNPCSKTLKWVEPICHSCQSVKLIFNNTWRLQAAW